MALSVRELSPFRLIIGNEDVTFLLDNGFTFSNVDPGGCEAASFSIPKDMPGLLRGQPVRLDSGLHVAWEGRVSQVQRSLGARTQIVCEGYGALLKDNAASMVFIDRDITRWTGPSLQRQINLAANGAMQSGQVGNDGSAPALVLGGTGPWTTNLRVDATYDAGPNNLIGKIYSTVNSNSRLSSSFSEALHSSTDGGTTATATPLSLTLAASTSSSQYSTFGTPTRWAFWELLFAGTGGDSAGDYTAYITKQAVYGNHGLTLRGSDPGGLYPSDIVGWVQQQIAGLKAGVIVQTDASGYIVPHYVQYTPVGYDTYVNDMAVAQAWHWGVWPNLQPRIGSSTPRLDFRPRPAAGSFTAACRRQDCDEVDIREDLSQQFNTAIVNYSDVAGVSGSVTVTIDNPILDAAQIGTREVVFNAGTMDSATASVFGKEALQILIAQQRVAGTMNFNAPVDGMVPWLLKAGIDRVRVLDLPSADAFGAYNDVPISRVECSGATSGFSTSVEVGSGANLVETLQARLAAATVLAGQGG